MRLRRTLSLSALIALGACALAPLQPDLSARAPLLEGFGQSDFAFTASHPTARRHFTSGVLQGYAFNHAEAVRQFKAALAFEPACAMCAWGVAWQLGPNINAPARGDLKEAQRYVQYALRMASPATARERALIEAMAVRYGVQGGAVPAGQPTPPALGEVCWSNRSDSGKAHPLDVAYAERMSALLLAYPDDPDIATLWAEAQLVATPGDWWNDSTGVPAPRVAQVVDRMERLLRQRPRHTGLNHYLIHAADAAPAAKRAVAAADRLAALAPQSPHLVHMPSHIYVRVGRYAEAANVNQAAIDADVALEKEQAAQGFANSFDWRGHNTHFLWYARLMEGQGDAALATARTLAERTVGRNSPYAEYLRSLPALTLLRLARWEALLVEPLPPGDNGIARALGEHARGLALARVGRVDEAQGALARVEAAAQDIARTHTGDSDNSRMLRDMGQMAAARLRADIALALQRGDEALAAHAQAVDAAKRPDDSEPPMLAAGATLALGEAQLALGQAAAAEASFRAELQARPESGWALRGLVRALQAQGKTTEAAVVRERLDSAWPLADAALKALG